MLKQFRINDLLKTFSSVERKDWEKVAASEINDEFPDRKLTWKGPENLTFLPYYDAGNSYAGSLRSFHLEPSQNTGIAPRT